MNYRDELLKRKRAYFASVGDATTDSLLMAEAKEQSVAGESRAKFIEMDFTAVYNAGLAPDMIANDKRRKDYLDFLEAFELEQPNGKPPKTAFRLPD